MLAPSTKAIDGHAKKASGFLFVKVNLALKG
jgi:hypothetical protein